MEKQAKMLGVMDGWYGNFESINRVYSKNTAAPTIQTFQGGGRQTKIARNVDMAKIIESEWFLREIKEENFDTELEYATNEDFKPTVEDYLITAKDGEKYGVFRLSPLECLLLMNVRREDAEKMLSVNSNTQCYKTAGNSIVVSVLVALFSQLNINGIKKWNDMTDDERYSIIRPGE